MLNRSQNPAFNPAIAGNARRFVIHSVEVVRARIDRPTKDALDYFKRLFAGPKPTDTISASMVFRRAVEVYRQRIAAIQTDPQALQVERGLLTLNTRLPKKSKAMAAGATIASDSN